MFELKSSFHSNWVLIATVSENGLAKRIGLESVYSIIEEGPGSAQEHFDVIDRLWQ
jgi:hypothetical protein